MKSLEYYRNRELETGDNTVGDSFEAMIHANNAYLIMDDTGEVQHLKDELLRTGFSNCFVFCMFEASDSNHFSFSDEQKEKLLEFGDTALLITDRNEFLRRVTVALDAAGIKGQNGSITYYDETVDSADFWVRLLMGGMSNVAFWKRNLYAYQQEFRLMIEPPKTESDYYELDIGSIEDISIILPAKDALSLVVQPHSNLT